MMVNFLACEVKPEESCEKILEVLSQDFRDIELPEQPCLSLEDKRAMEILNKTVEKVGNHYSVGLLWKEDNTVFQNNRKMALKRLEGVKKRFLNNPKFFEDYCYSHYLHFLLLVSNPHFYLCCAHLFLNLICILVSIYAPL